MNSLIVNDEESNGHTAEMEEVEEEEIEVMWGTLGITRVCSGV